MASRNNAKSPRIMLTLSVELLEKVDALADKNYTSRSAIIRRALADYINSQSVVPARPAEQQGSDEHPDDVRFKKFMAAIYDLDKKS